MVKREVLDKITMKSLGQGDEEYFIEMLYGALKKGFRKKEILYTCIYNSEHESKTSTNTFKLLNFGIS